MVSRKRGRAEMESEEVKEEPTLLQRVRNMWEFAALNQYLFLFGDAVKLANIEVEDFEQECLKDAPSEKLSDIGLALLKFVSSHKGLTPDIFDEYTRRQYIAKSPQRNPFGVEEEPNKFAEFDIFTKIRVLYQLSTWTFHNPDRIRERMPERDYHQSNWRMEPQGIDIEGRLYFLLDDNRLYRQTNPPLPAPPPTKKKAKAKARKSKGSRSSKRQKMSATAVEEESGAEEEDAVTQTNGESAQEDDGFGGRKWELIAVTLDDYKVFLASIRRSKDEDEQDLYKLIEEDVLPIIVEADEEKARKEAKRLRELENIQKLATAKRSSRLAAKSEKQKEIEATEEAEKKRLADLAMARKEQEKQHKMEEARESRMMTREQRLKEREVKRILHEEELKRLAEDSKRLDSNEARISERHLKAEMEKRQRELEKLNQEEDWFFDCSICGVHGENLDDGSHSIACEKCNVWQHSKCHGIKQEDAEKDEFHFVCNDCKRKATQPKVSLKLRFGASASPKSEEKPNGAPTKNSSAQSSKAPPRTLDGVHIPRPNPPTPSARPMSQQANIMNGPSLSPQGQSPGPPGSYMVGSAYRQQSSPLATTPRPVSSGMSNGYLPNGLASGAAAFSHYANGSANGAVQNGSHPYSPYAATAGTQGQTPYQRPANYDPHLNGFSRLSPPNLTPTASFGSNATQSFGSPSKQPHQPSTSPQPNGHAFNTPRPAAMSPSGQSFNMAAQLAKQTLAGSSPGLSPAKHDHRRPASSHSLSDRPMYSPALALSPNAQKLALSPSAQKVDLTPPVKKDASVSPPLVQGQFGGMGGMAPQAQMVPPQSPQRQQQQTGQ